MYEDNLIRMANQIGLFFDSMPDRQEALEGIASHLKKFWDPRMRQAFIAQVDSGKRQDISAIVMDSVRKHRSLIQ